LIITSFVLVGSDFKEDKRCPCKIPTNPASPNPFPICPLLS